MIFSRMFRPGSAGGKALTGAAVLAAMALRPSQLRATAMDGALMIPGAVTLRDRYRTFRLPVTIMAGAGDKVVFKRMAGWLAEAIPGSQSHIVENAGHMVHYAAAEQVAAAVENVAALAP